MGRRPPPLRAGQVPLAELVRIERAHDVRTLRVCAACSGLGNAGTMLDVGKEWFHGRCFLGRFGLAALLGLPPCKTARLMLGDVGEGTMRRLLTRRGEPRPRRARRRLASLQQSRS
jgi:hypothetical protein